MNQLYKIATSMGIEIIKDKIPVRKVKGLCVGDIIILDKSIDTHAEENCILAEELGHQITSHNAIINSKDIVSIKQELRARRWAHEFLIDLDSIIAAYKIGCRNNFEFAEFLDITEEFLEEAIETLTCRYGLFKIHNDYIIYFQPITVIECCELSLSI